MLIRIAAKEQMMTRTVRMRTDSEVISGLRSLHPQCPHLTVLASYDWNAGSPATEGNSLSVLRLPLRESPASEP